MTMISLLDFIRFLMGENVEQLIEDWILLKGSCFSLWIPTII